MMCHSAPCFVLFGVAALYAIWCLATFALFWTAGW
jgi:hypothetical protein